eukprot:scaffold175304_cov24-Prasinocladus_malaysianus.AAC.1
MKTVASTSDTHHVSYSLRSRSPGLGSAPPVLTHRVFPVGSPHGQRQHSQQLHRSESAAGGGGETCPH